MGRAAWIEDLAPHTRLFLFRLLLRKWELEEDGLYYRGDGHRAAITRLDLEGGAADIDTARRLERSVRLAQQEASLARGEGGGPAGAASRADRDHEGME